LKCDGLAHLARIGKGTQTAVGQSLWRRTITQIPQIEMAHPPTEQTAYEKHEGTPSLCHRFVTKRVASIELFLGMIATRSFPNVEYSA